MLLSDIDGLYTSDTNHYDNAEHLPQISQITEDILAMAGSANASYASGGMVTKLEAARIATAAGCHMIICDGRGATPLFRLQNSGRCSFFVATESPFTARKQWIAGALAPRGGITIDDGAAKALREGKSLLPAGVLAVDGHFDRGDLISVADQNGKIVGLSSYASQDAYTIMGHKSREIQTMVGYRGRDEMIHSDNLVVIDS